MRRKTALRKCEIELPGLSLIVCRVAAQRFNVETICTAVESRVFGFFDLGGGGCHETFAKAHTPASSSAMLFQRNAATQILPMTQKIIRSG
ncbi:hypothetical protein [Burkholderia sp. lig30]|jgi:hypothetical protein|uniref:hypothetical protein n=1 Tax=Burkholderia sp. lig30 TaxID=1192124 RepID=UPI00128EE0C6|nr:hypothetical protein [Burkholderia sp. lig30]